MPVYLGLMSTGEELADRPEQDPRDPFDFIFRYREKNEETRRLMDEMIAKPSRKTIEGMAESMVKPRLVQDLYMVDFFKDRGPLAVSTAVSALVDSVRDTMVILKALEPESQTILEIQPSWYEDPAEAPIIIISIEDAGTGTVLADQAMTERSVNDFADLIIKDEDESADKFSKLLKFASETYYLFSLRERLVQEP